MRKQYNVLSPDGFPIAHDWFASEAEAWAFAAVWRRRYEQQGYYAADRGEGALPDPPSPCRNPPPGGDRLAWNRVSSLRARIEKSGTLLGTRSLSFCVI
jgi:hypothetical protein